LEKIDNSNLPVWGEILGYITVSAIAFPLSRFISRTEELAADRFGKIITLESGYPLSDIEHLFSINEMRFSQWGGFLDTHPEYWERKKNLGLR
jgi:Zn-dependent protease with chaperone function